jgi:hypothetical protein
MCGLILLIQLRESVYFIGLRRQIPRKRTRMTGLTNSSASWDTRMRQLNLLSLNAESGWWQNWTPTETPTHLHRFNHEIASTRRTGWKWTCNLHGTRQGTWTWLLGSENLLVFTITSCHLPDQGRYFVWTNVNCISGLLSRHLVPNGIQLIA